MSSQSLHLNLTNNEQAAIHKLCLENELSLPAVFRQALRWYQLIQERIKAGETFSFSGDAQRAKEFLGPLADVSAESLENYKLANLKEAMKSLTDEERIAIFSDYCRECGCNDPRCRCWDDS